MAKQDRKVWVLTFEVNDHDQHGEYFMAAFENKPDHERLARALQGAGEMPKDIMAGLAFLEHLLKGGGRRNDEHIWYNLREEPLK